jgi:hypothetical protein
VLLVIPSLLSMHESAHGRLKRLFRPAEPVVTH